MCTIFDWWAMVFNIYFVLNVLSIMNINNLIYFWICKNPHYLAKIRFLRACSKTNVNLLWNLKTWFGQILLWSAILQKVIGNSLMGYLWDFYSLPRTHKHLMTCSFNFLYDGSWPVRFHFSSFCIRTKTCKEGYFIRKLMMKWIRKYLWL